MVLPLSMTMSLHYSAAAITAVLVAYKLIGRLIDNWACKHFTVVPELKRIGHERDPGHKLKGTVVICGGRYA